MYTAECESSIMEGCLDLGILYQIGSGVPKNIQKSIELFTKVCDVDTSSVTL
jgi:TPR repeat protein